MVCNKKKKKKKRKENRFSLNGNGIMSSFLGRQFYRSTLYLKTSTDIVISWLVMAYACTPQFLNWEHETGFLMAWIFWGFEDIATQKCHMPSKDLSLGYPIVKRRNSLCGSKIGNSKCFCCENENLVIKNTRDCCIITDICYIGDSYQYDERGKIENNIDGESQCCNG